MRYYTIKPKKQRTPHVINQSGYQYQDVPAIILHDKWLGHFGFSVGNSVIIDCSDKELVIKTK